MDADNENIQDSFIVQIYTQFIFLQIIDILKPFYIESRP